MPSATACPEIAATTGLGKVYKSNKVLKPKDDMFFIKSTSPEAKFK